MVFDNYWSLFSKQQPMLVLYEKLEFECDDLSQKVTNLQQ